MLYVVVPVFILAATYLYFFGNGNAAGKSSSKRDSSPIRRIPSSAEVHDSADALTSFRDEKALSDKQEEAFSAVKKKESEGKSSRQKSSLKKFRVKLPKSKRRKSKSKKMHAIASAKEEIKHQAPTELLPSLSEKSQKLKVEEKQRKSVRNQEGKEWKNSERRKRLTKPSKRRHNLKIQERTDGKIVGSEGTALQQTTEDLPEVTEEFQFHFQSIKEESKAGHDSRERKAKDEKSHKEGTSQPQPSTDLQPNVGEDNKDSVPDVSKKRRVSKRVSHRKRKSKADSKRPKKERVAEGMSTGLVPQVIKKTSVHDRSKRTSQNESSNEARVANREKCQTPQSDEEYPPLSINLEPIEAKKEVGSATGEQKKDMKSMKRNKSKRYKTSKQEGDE